MHKLYQLLYKADWIQVSHSIHLDNNPHYYLIRPVEKHTD